MPGLLGALGGIATAAAPYVPFLGGIASNLFGAKQGGRGVDASKLWGPEGTYAPYMEHLETLKGYGQDFMDPNSPYNIQQKNQIMQNTYDQQAFGNLLGDRNAAKYGMGGYSGILGQQQQANLARARGMGVEQANQAAMKSNLMGMNQMNQLLGQYKGLGEMQGQHLLHNQAIQNQMAQGMWGGLGTGLLQYGFESMPGAAYKPEEEEG